MTTFGAFFLGVDAVLWPALVVQVIRHHRSRPRRRAPQPAPAITVIRAEEVAAR